MGDNRLVKKSQRKLFYMQKVNRKTNEEMTRLLNVNRRGSNMTYTKQFRGPPTSKKEKKTKKNQMTEIKNESDWLEQLMAHDLNMDLKMMMVRSYVLSVLLYGDLDSYRSHFQEI